MLLLFFSTIVLEILAVYSDLKILEEKENFKETSENVKRLFIKFH